MARLLGVKRETVYAYVSRGLLRPVRRGGRKGSWFAKSDVEQFRDRQSQQRLAAEIRVATAVTRADQSGLFYRGYDAVQLAERAELEEVASILWQSPSTDSAGWKPETSLVAAVRKARNALDHPITNAEAIRVGSAALASTAKGLDDVSNAGSLVASLVEGLAGRRGRTGLPLASRLANKLSSNPTPELMEAVRVAAVLCADNGLSPSALAARVAGSYGADLGGIVTAGLAVHSARLHGAASSLVAAKLSLIAQGTPASALLEGGRRMGPELVGLGLRKFPQGDPRYRPIVEAVRRVAPASPYLRALDSFERAAESAGLPAPNLDTALAVLAIACDLKHAAGETLFAVARIIGWIAHGLEAADHGPVRLSTNYIGDE